MVDRLSEFAGSISSSLLCRVRNRDQEAWSRLVRLYGPLVRYWLHRDHLQPEDAEDVFQDVFNAVAQSIGQFDRSQPGNTFRGWLRRITRNKVADHFRRRAAEPAGTGGSTAVRRLGEIEDSASDVDPDEEQAVKELRQRAMQLIQAEFEPRTWEMFLRVTVQNQTARDVAADMGVTPGAVRVAKSRVLQRLREELDGLEEI